MSKDIQKTFYSTKTYEHSIGLSCCFRQWRAESHCRFLHGYALQVKLVFKADELDRRNWVVDFGGLKPVKQWLQDTFDHKTLIAKDDPLMHVFEGMCEADLIDMQIVEHVGCERFAEMIFDYTSKWLKPQSLAAYLDHVEVKEHGGNSAICKRRGEHVDILV